MTLTDLDILDAHYQCLDNQNIDDKKTVAGYKNGQIDNRKVSADFADKVQHAKALFGNLPLYWDDQHDCRLVMSFDAADSKRLIICDTFGVKIV